MNVYPGTLFKIINSSEIQDVNYKIAYTILEHNNTIVNLKFPSINSNYTILKA